MTYYIYFNGQQIGPMSAAQIFSYPVDSQTQVSKNGGQWQPLYCFPELMQMLNNPAARQYGTATSKYSKTTAGVLALLLGALGIQYFYLGKTGAGFLTILLTIVTCGGWEIITFIQGILMLCMTDEEFEQKYVYTDKSFPLF